MSQVLLQSLYITGALLILINSIFSQEISDQCLGCICQASSGCNQNQGCSGDVCGPFLITWPYWSDAGKFAIRGTNPTDPDVYSKCANDLYCGAETVRGYMRTYAKDCNNDGIIDCEDYARIHKLGFGACGDPNFGKSEFSQAFSQCKAEIQPQ